MTYNPRDSTKSANGSLRTGGSGANDSLASAARRGGLLVSDIVERVRSRVDRHRLVSAHVARTRVGVAHADTRLRCCRRTALYAACAADAWLGRHHPLRGPRRRADDAACLVVAGSNMRATTRVAFTLAADGAGTLLTLEHTGWSGIGGFVLSRMHRGGWARNFLRRQLPRVLERTAEPLASEP